MFRLKRVLIVLSSFIALGSFIVLGSFIAVTVAAVAVVAVAVTVTAMAMGGGALRTSNEPRARIGELKPPDGHVRRQFVGV
jgi:hypothetical protein